MAGHEFFDDGQGLPVRPADECQRQRTEGELVVGEHGQVPRAPRPILEDEQGDLDRIIGSHRDMQLVSYPVGLSREGGGARVRKP